MANPCECGCGATARRRFLAGHNRRGTTFTLTPEAREKIAAGKRGAKNPMFGKRGADWPWWRGGRTKTKAGYVQVIASDHPMAGKHGRVYEHRLVMSEIVGRVLDSREHVHHINGVKDDNREENLMLFPDTAAHHRWHKEQRRRQTP